VGFGAMQENGNKGVLFIVIPSVKDCHNSISGFLCLKKHINSKCNTLLVGE
jgi:hypothetical protein